MGGLHFQNNQNRTKKKSLSGGTKFFESVVEVGKVCGPKNGGCGAIAIPKKKGDALPKTPSAEKREYLYASSHQGRRGSNLVAGT